MVGSANYGYRSVEKDLEAQVTIGKSEFQLNISFDLDMNLAIYMLELKGLFHQPR